MVRTEVRARAGHPAILCYTIGNEIPASIVRWHGRRKLERFLERQKAGLSLKSDIDLDLILRQILQKANEFVPSESGSILLDDPFRKVAVRRENELVFIATFGQSSRHLIGQSLSAKFGIVGQVYQTGTPYVSADVKEDDFFYAEFDQQLGHKTHSVVCVPIYIGKTVCGVSIFPTPFQPQPVFFSSNGSLFLSSPNDEMYIGWKNW